MRISLIVYILLLSDAAAFSHLPYLSSARRFFGPPAAIPPVRPGRRSSLSMYDEKTSPDQLDGADPQIPLGDWRSFRAELVRSGIRTSARVTTAAFQTAPELIGDWAHSVPMPEAGGLLLRMPIELELYIGALGVTEPLNRASGLLRAELHGRADAEARWFQTAGEFIRREIDRIFSLAEGPMKGNGERQLFIDNLGEPDRRFIMWVVDHQDHWQEVELVTEVNDGPSDTFSAVTVNRPLAHSAGAGGAFAMRAGEVLPNRILFGSGAASSDRDRDLLHKFVTAFGRRANIYDGGTDNRHLPAMILHGIPDLPGSRAIAPGIYEGGTAAAVDSVLSEEYGPSAFRFFVGQTVRQSRDMVRRIESGAYAAVACHQDVALREGVGRSVPLWHEVLDLCGGDLEALSRLEHQGFIDEQRQNMEETHPTN